MNRDDAFELELARWVREGPEVAPTEPVAAALEHVRTHPRRPRAIGRSWRSLMGGMTLTHVPVRQSRSGLAAIAAVVIVVVGVGAFGAFNGSNQGGSGAGGGTPTPSVASTPVSTPTPAPTKAPSPSLAAGVATGEQTCTAKEPGTTTVVAGVTQVRGQVVNCRNSSTDPRVAGDATITMASDEHPDGRWLSWGVIELRNDGGTWNGVFTVAAASAAATKDFYSVMLGSGGYDGLEAVSHLTSIGAGALSITTRVSDVGLVFSGTQSCSVVNAGAQFEAGGVTSTRGLSLQCADAASNKGSHGAWMDSVSIDERADGSADIWGNATMTSGTQTWKGMFFGTIDPGYTTHRIHVLLRGSGWFGNQLLRVELVGDGTHFDITTEMIGVV